MYGGADLLDALERLLADGPGASNLRPELSSLCEQWQSRQREALSAGVEQLAKSAVSAISAPATSDFGLFRAEIERLWSRELQVQTVQARLPSLRSTVRSAFSRVSVVLAKML